MIKFFISAWNVICFLWTYIRPIYQDLMRIIQEVRASGLTDEAARKKVFQDITDFIQKNGLKAVPDSVLNCSIELTYQIYQWKYKAKAA